MLHVKVVTACLKAGIPLNNLDHFWEALEEHAYKLANRHGMYNLISLCLQMSRSAIKLRLERRKFQSF